MDEQQWAAWLRATMTSDVIVCATCGETLINAKPEWAHRSGHLHWHCPCGQVFPCAFCDPAPRKNAPRH